jgi:peptidoglycan hydrolase CwlO-like protein
MKLIYRFLILLVFISALGAVYHRVMAQNCGSEDECRKLISEYESKLTSVRAQKNTLASQIQFFDTQIYLTSLRVIDAQNKIKKTQEEIDSISGRIVGLNESLDHVTKLLINKIAENYKRRDVPLLSIFIDSNNASTLTNRLKYSKTAEQNDQKLALEVQQAKDNFEKQKNLREQKKVQLDKLSQELVGQQAELKSQQESKRILLAQTQSSESVYQNLLSKAQAELSGFTSFAQSAGGGGLTSFGSGSNGWFYTQRDPAWGNMILPGSSSSVSLAGCAVSSVAMVCKSYGQGTTPASIVSNSANFIGGDMLNSAFSCAGHSTSWIGTSQDAVKALVSANTPVILRLAVGGGSISGLHFIVAYGWDSGKNDFKIHDPYYGPDKFFTDRYNWGEVTTAIAIR